MEVTFGIDGAFYPGSDQELNADSLEILLNALIDLNGAYLRTMARKGKTIPFLYEAGIVYGRTLSWDSIPNLYVKGYGDCKSLTAAFCAQARLLGHECRPCFRFMNRVVTDKRAWANRLAQAEQQFGRDSERYALTARQNDGGLDYHILVATDGTMSYKGQPLGEWHDPSKVLGMTDQYPQ